MALTKNIFVAKVKTLNKLSSDHLPVIYEITSINIPTNPPKPIEQTNWVKFAMRLHELTLHAHEHTHMN